MLFYSWHTTAQRFGKSRLCGSDPGQASIACLIKSKVLNTGIYPACHHAHAGQCEPSYINSWRIFSNSGQSPGSFTPGPQNGQTQPSCQGQCHSGPSSPLTRNAHQRLVWVSCTVVGWFLQSAECSVPGKSEESTGWCRSVWGGQVQLSGWFRGVDTPWRQVKIDLHSCLPCFPPGSRVPEARVTGRLMSQLLNHQSPQSSLLWEVPLTWGHALKLYCKLQLRRSWFTSLSSLSDETFRNNFCVFPSSSVACGSTWNQ